MSKDFRSISLKADLVEKVRRRAVGRRGYRSIAEFVSEAIRLRLEQLGLMEDED